MASTFETARQILQRAVGDGHSPPPLSRSETPASRCGAKRSAGSRSTQNRSPTRDDTIFDLASLTKVLATTALVMRQVERGALGLDDPVARYVPAWRDEGAVVVTIRDLLAHCSGLPAHVPLFREHHGSRGVRRRDRPNAARVRAADDIRLQRSRIHAARLHPGVDRDPRRPVRHDAPADGRHSGSAVPSAGALETADGSHAGRSMARAPARRRGGR